MYIVFRDTYAIMPVGKMIAMFQVETKKKKPQYGNTGVFLVYNGTRSTVRLYAIYACLTICIGSSNYTSQYRHNK